jgi:hypothetical protein
MVSLLKTLILVLTTGLLSSASVPAFGAVETAKLRYQPNFVFTQILIHKELQLDPTKPFPEIRFSSQVTLKEFQDDVEPQWGLRPDVITNAYVVQKNKIYLMDDKKYYDSHKRCIDDSLAHELTHYIQSKYRGWDLNDDSLEWDAIDVQTWFREQYCR